MLWESVHSTLLLTMRIGRCCGCGQVTQHPIIFIIVLWLNTDHVQTTAAALNITEPSSTGIGGDMFCLYYNAETKKISSLNGSGRYAGNVTLDQVRKDLNIGPDQSGHIPMNTGRAVTTPGAAAGWVDTVEKFGSGRLSLEQILRPAIELGEEGFPVSELASSFVS